MRKIIIFIIISLIVSVCIHELGHIFIAIVTRSKIDEIHIGMGPVILKLEKVNIHLLPIIGYVDCEINISNKVGMIKMIAIAMGGIVVNFVLSAIAICMKYGIFSFLFFFINLSMGLFSLLPIQGTDMYAVLVNFGFIEEDMD